MNTGIHSSPISKNTRSRTGTNYLTTKNNYSQIPLFIKEESSDSLVAMFTKPSGESKIIRVQE